MLLQQLLAFLLNLFADFLKLLLLFKLFLGELRSLGIWDALRVLQLEWVHATLHWIHAPWCHSSHVVNQLDLGVSPDWLSLLNREVCRFFRAFHVLELNRGRLLLWMAINPDDLAKVVEEGVDVHIVELVLRHVLDVDREAASVDHLLGLEWLSGLVAASWGAKAST